MKKLLLLLSIIINGLFFAQPSPKGDLDTMVFDLSSALIQNSSGGISYFEFPVYAVTTGGISNFDFWFKFDQTKLTYESATAVDVNLDSYSNFNTQNLTLSNTTSGPNLSYSIKGNKPLVKLRFVLAKPDVKISKSDFFNCSVLFNGAPANFYWKNTVTSEPNLGIDNQVAQLDCVKGLKNPTCNDFDLSDEHVQSAILSTSSGNTVWHQTNNEGKLSVPFESCPSGNYILQLIRDDYSCIRRISVLK
jgi:hypothetical protein